MKKTLLFIFLTITFFCFSKDFENDINIEKETWNIEWGELQGKNLSLSNQFLITTLPVYFMDNIQLDYDHYLNNDESKNVIEHIIKKKISTLNTSLTKKINSRDNFFFDNNSNKKNYDKILEEIEEIEEKIEALKNLNVSIIKRIISLPVNYLPEENKSLTSKKDYQIKYYMEQQDLDYYVTGNIEEINNNLILKIKLFSKYTESPEVLWNGIGTSEDILSYRDDILDKLSKKIISDEIKKYNVTVVPSDSLIYINEEFRGLGNYTGYFIDGDKLNLDISKEGFETFSTKTRVSKINNKLTVELIPIDTKSIVVNSEPRSASAYYGSKFIGLTPLEVPVFSYSQKLTLSLDGYMDKSFVVSPESKDIKIILNEGFIDPEKNFIKEKSRFYTATAIFSFSLAVPLFFSTQGDNIDSVYNYISIGNAVIWSINLFYRLYKYLGAAELSVE